MRKPLLIAACLLAWPVATGRSSGAEAESVEVEQWDIFELSLDGPAAGNPFLHVQFSAQFQQGQRTFEPDGFYDGDGVYRVRFMPDALGTWTYTTKSNRRELDKKTGQFTCVAPSKGNHGPVVVHNEVHLAYADGTPYFQVGTTCYAWVHQTDALMQQTLKTLAKAPFNKLRMCVFPKHYSYNQNEPPHYPFPRDAEGRNDYHHFNPEFFRHFERRVGDLRELGIEADLILFHPYDRWGYARMDDETDNRYLRYVVARLAAYRNVWWSMANEFDLMRNKSMDDWHRYFQIVQRYDPYGHMRGIHNCRGWYDHNKPWVTHASIQSSDFSNCRELREKYRKPIVFDECKYEGNIPMGWGNISAREMTHRFWLGTIAGCYVGHGETYKHPEDILWWSKGGVLHGESPARIALLKRIVEPLPFDEMIPSELTPGNHLLAKPEEVYLVYSQRPATIALQLDGKRPYKVDGIDTWTMATTSLNDAKPGRFAFSAPGGNYLLRLAAYGPGEKTRPEVKATATPTTGIAPLTVRFSTDSRLRLVWSFGDGSPITRKANPEHVYQRPGLYTAVLTATAPDGQSTAVRLPISVDRVPGSPIVRVGFRPRNDLPGGALGNSPVKLHGKITRAADGSYVFGEREPWRWISVGDGPIEDLEGLKSFTILGWARASSLELGPGGNRFVFNLNYNRSGFDLVHLADGRLRLAVNEWPDRIDNDSSPRKIRIGQWVFFAVAYDATEAKENVRWYFGDPNTPAVLDRTTTYNRGETGAGSGPLTVGNYNHTIHGHGQDRQFRGALRAVQIYGSRTGSDGALPLEAIRRHQQER